MNIPKEIREKFKQKPTPKPQPMPKIVPKCWKQLGDLGRQQHDHTADGTCILRNHSSEAPFKKRKNISIDRIGG